VVELGMPMVDLARKFAITPAAVSDAVQRGEKMAKKQGYQLDLIPKVVPVFTRFHLFKRNRHASAMPHVCFCI